MEVLEKKAGVQRYSEYKDSDVEWLGILPSHWKVEKGKWLFKKDERKVREEDEVVTCFRNGEVTLRSNRRVDGFTNSLKEHGYQGVRKGDLVIHHMDAFAGAIGVSDSEGKSTPVYSVCTPLNERQANPYFYAYFLRDLAQSGFIESLEKGIRERSSDFRFSDFGKLLLPFPPPEEQTAIANFLDRKTELIDRAIDIKQKQIELLKERRQILIHKAVTCGLNPNVPLKPSGLEWIGDIPEHWEVKKIKFLFSLIGGGTPNKDRTDYWNGKISWVSPKDMKSDYIDITDDYLTDKGLQNSSSKLIEKDTVLMVVRSGILQRAIPVAISNIKLALNQDMKAFIPKIDISPKYFFYYVKGNDQYLKHEWVKKGATVESVEIDLLRNSLLPVPPLEEQFEIVKHIEAQCSRIRIAVSIKVEEIEKLKELKTTLINSAVTGKIKVN